MWRPATPAPRTAAVRRRERDETGRRTAPSSGTMRQGGRPLFLAAAIQMTAGPDREANQERALALLSQACDREARLIGLPEVWEHVGPAAQKRSFAGPLEGLQLAKIRELAAKRDVFVVSGSVSQRGADTSPRYD